MIINDCDNCYRLENPLVMEDLDRLKIKNVATATGHKDLHIIGALVIHFGCRM